MSQNVLYRGKNRQNGTYGGADLKLKHAERIEAIKRMVLRGYKYYEMARELGVNRRTIYRDIKKWEQTPDYEAWFRQEFPLVSALEDGRVPSSSDKSDA